MNSTYPSLVVATIMFAFFGCMEKPRVFVQKGNAVFGPPENASAPKEMNLTIASNYIVGVTASHSDLFYSEPGLKMFLIAHDPDFKILQSSDFITIPAKFLHANVAVTSGEMSFMDATGHVLLPEKNGRGKRLTPNTSQQRAYKDMLEERTFQKIWVKTDQPAGASFWAQTPQVIRYSSDEITIDLI